MYKIGIISDVHGNLTALLAILELLNREGVDEIIHTGDIVDIGARSKECADVLLSLTNATLLLGNHDKDYLDNSYEHKALSHVSAEHKQFVFDSLGDGYRKHFAKFPLQCERTFGNSTFKFMHYALSYKQYPFKPIEKVFTAENFDNLFAEVLPATAIFYGHKHEPCDVHGRSCYVNVGSVACHKDAVARGVILCVQDDGAYTYQRVYAPYNRTEETSLMLTSGLPDAQYMIDFYMDHKYATKE